MTAKKITEEKEILSLEEQLIAKRKEDSKKFQQGYKELCEKYGYVFEPVIEISCKGVTQSGFNIRSTK